MARIVVESGPMRGKIFALPDKGQVMVGRVEGCGIQLDDARVSRVHFTISSRGKDYLLEDKSRNGTFINGLRLEKKALRQGDMIRLGETFLSYYEEKKDPLIGKTIAGYRIDHRLGRGAMGTVYRAIQVSLNRRVALKILSQDLTEDRVFVKQFLQEARSEGKLNHPNVVQIHDAGQEDDLFFLSMEYMAGGSLQGKMDRDGRLPPLQLLRWMLDASNALIWAEEHGIVHRDIKPDNLMLDENNTLKLGDFGIAADNRRSKTLMHGGKIVGTPLYMAPEQAMGKPADHRVDIYALGSTLYTGLSGAFPFEGENSTEILVKKCKEKPRPLSKMAPDLPKKLVALVEKMIEQRPEDRHQTAREAHDAIADVYDFMKAHAGVDSGTTSTGSTTARARPGTGTTRTVLARGGWKRRLLYIALGVAALGLIGFLLSRLY